MVQAQAIPPVRLLALRGFAAHQLACMLYSLVRVSRRADWKPSASIPRAQFPKDSWSALCFLERPGGRDGGSNAALVPPGQPMLTSAQRMQPAVRAGVSLGAPAASNPFPLNNFKHFLTLFSKFFSSFPHGTCSLSVSRQYLALDGIYHLLWAAFPNNPTLRKRLVERLGARRRGSHPLRRPLPGDLGAARRRGRLSRLQFAGRGPEIFKLGSSRFARRY